MTSAFESPVKLTICTWFVGDQAGEESIFPQMGINSSRVEFQRVYWQCIWLFFKSARVTNPRANLILFVNAPDHPLCREFASRLGELGVRIISQSFDSRPPRGFTDKFGNQLFICDIIRRIAGMAGAVASDQWLVLDSDCLIFRELGDLGRALEAYGILTYDVRYKPEDDINGLNQITLGQLGFELGVQSESRLLPYSGGEFFAATHDMCVRLSPLLDNLLQNNIERWKVGKTCIKEEAHLLSLAYARLGIAHGTADAFIRRIWTTLKYSDASTSDMALPIWHVPAEKRLGFYRIYAQAVANPVKFDRLVGSPDFQLWSGRMLGIPSRTLQKAVLDFTAKLRRMLSERAK